VKYVDEFRRGEAAQRLISAIRKAAGDTPMVFMEVCGTHTMAIARNGIRSILPENIRLISGPGCPVCVTPNHTVDHAIAMARSPGLMVTTFGDMMKVPGSSASLDLVHAQGGDVRIVASTLEAMALAERFPDRKVVFLGIGFETTAPTVAASLMEAKRRRMLNFSVLTAHKVMPPAMRAISTGDVKIDGYICPGHVSTIIGSKPYTFLAEEFGIGCVVSGFEPLDILQSILMLARQIRREEPAVEIQYSRAVKPEGNPTAQEVLGAVFSSCDSAWRGIGSIPGSGLTIRQEYGEWDAETQIDVDVEPTREPKGCLCGQVLQGRVLPSECRHFGKDCTPGNPVGPCMVSSEGTCAAYYKYHL
jgi:hydrogenase expression/formation protein HypD